MDICNLGKYDGTNYFGYSFLLLLEDGTLMSSGSTNYGINAIEPSPYS